ncbi:hypothetical protein [Micromonospora sp. NPDC005173]|uniref:hypothetical protein n=1 Tax=Micromonospora sp. NPDC005173 TaxID=3157165 RepID=UPI0033A1494E
MDLWDLTRLLFRRWYVALPILLATILISALVGQSVKPDYRATGHVVLIPAPGPADSTSKPAGKPRPKNPWLDLGFNALCQAAILNVVNQKTLASLKDAGLSDSVLVQLDERSPIFIVEAVAETPTKATATVREVIKDLEADVEAQQNRYGVLAEDKIGTQTLTDGSDVETVTSKTKRALIVTVGVGLLLTAAGTISLDALLRRRRSQHAKRGDQKPAQSDERREDAPANASSPRSTPPLSDGDDREDSTRYSQQPPRTISDGPGSVYGARRADGQRTAESTGAPVARPPAVEETIILPRPADRWAEQDMRDRGR